MGYSVTGIADEGIAGRLNRGEAPLFEPGLDDLMRLNVEAGRLRYTHDYEQGLRGADFVFLAIDTPVGEQDDSDLSPIESAVDDIAEHLTGPIVLCVTAQVPIGTCDRIGSLLVSRRPDLRTAVAYVPEFLRLGTAIASFREADRIIIGADDAAVAERITALYVPLGRPIRVTDVRSAEMGKHASNAFLATSISFINEIADLCEVTGCDVSEVARILKLDRRIGPHAFLNPGIGYAGGTLGREVRALHRIGVGKNVETPLLDSVHLVNSRRANHLIKRIEAAVTPLRGRKVGILGLTYKRGTNTLRRSVSLELADQLAGAGATVTAFDPLVSPNEVAGLSFHFAREPAEVARAADALVVVTPWDGLTVHHLRDWGKIMSRRLIFDAGNFFSRRELVAAGFEYSGVGR
jgi:UDPglucose 6-dehydrogenase